MSDSSTYLFLNDELFHRENAMIPAETSGLYYGAGCFETFLAENGNVFKFDEHIQRLNDGLTYLGCPADLQLDPGQILRQVHILLDKNRLEQERTKVRIQVSLNEKPGYFIDESLSLIKIITTKQSKWAGNPKKLIVSEIRAVPSASKPSRYKLSNMLHYRRAFREAKEKGKDDSVLLNIDGFVAETSIANIFWMKNESIFTPSESCDILPGIMRNSVIDILNSEGMKLNVGEYGMNELLEADFAWITNSSIEIAAVKTIGNSSFDAEHSFFSRLTKMLDSYKEKHIKHV